MKDSLGRCSGLHRADWFLRCLDVKRRNGGSALYRNLISPSHVIALIHDSAGLTLVLLRGIFATELK